MTRDWWDTPPTRIHIRFTADQIHAVTTAWNTPRIRLDDGQNQVTLHPTNQAALVELHNLTGILLDQTRPHTPMTTPLRIGDATWNGDLDDIREAMRGPYTCEAEDMRGDEFERCDATAVALRRWMNGGEPYQVCWYHARGDMVSLAHIAAALRGGMVQHDRRTD